MLIKMGSQPTILETRQQCKSFSITSVSFPKSGSYIVMNGVRDNDADLFCVSGEQMIHVTTLSGHSDSVSSYSFHPTLHILATASFELDSTIRIWDVSDPSEVKCVGTLERHSNSVFSVAFHPNLPILASGGTDKIPILWFLSPESFSLISKIVLPKQESWILDVVFHANLPILAIALENGRICLWKLSQDFSSVICSEIIGHGRYARCLKFHPFFANFGN
jgi:WD40 repeat protein